MSDELSLSNINGHLDPRFSAVGEAFVDNFSLRDEVGAAVCVYYQGKPVVDIWAGFADAERQRPWQQDTLVGVASTTKGFVALCVAILVDKGLLDLDKPVAHYWPEFAQAGKEHMPVRWLLTHQSGLPGVRRNMSMEEMCSWHPYTEELAATEPWWQPGTAHGYHALTFGFLVGEVVRRVCGTTLGQFFQQEVAQPLRADSFIGVPEEQHHRIADILPDPPLAPGEVDLLEVLRKAPESIAGRTFANPARTPQVMNTAEWRSAEVPSSNGHTTAAGVARIYAALAQGGELDGVRLLDASVIDQFRSEQVNGKDAILQFPTRIGVGFTLNDDEKKFGPNEKAFGHQGMGGSVGFADPENTISMGYVMNQGKMVSVSNPDRRWIVLRDAIYQSLQN